ncbi:putative cytochrome P450 [Lindgomyces ingoldianus]|uniref:Cytochrome P450 n=1 Tax=Lindgomyces ingoldianus TaxID=673940 RepID=A0ACB6RAK4_9PLEO|nr:putative cytochrome P450 [Lindgomyces ingoldianus]KAF2475793.1 putative cytochrome P450 [Lindgomyces ingoldianus]
MVNLLFVVAGGVLIWSLYRLFQVGRRPKGLPPGPPTMPIIGNLHQIPTKDPHIQFMQWAKEYGPVYSLILGTKVMIVLSKDQAVKDLLDKKSAIYSSRPDMYIGQTLVSGGHRVLMTPYGPTWRMIRKLAHTALHINKAVTYVPYQEIENKQMLYDMMEKPADLLEHFRRYSSSLTTSMVFGFRWKHFNDPRLQKMFHILDNFSRINSQGHAAIIDFYPILRQIPDWLAPIKREAKEHHKVEKENFLEYWLTAKNAIINKLPSVRPCACVDIVENQKEEGYSDDFASYISGSFLEAGSDTTSSELYGFAQAMLLYPEVQRRVQAEIDAQVGDDRLPTLEDMPKLPYIRACIKETHRWMPTTILGAVPHAVTEEDNYMGYRIPKGASLMTNVWAIHRDPNRYPNPETFVPERYFGDELNSADSAACSDVSQRDHFGFGSGRRVCPGTHVADRSMYLAMSRMLWAFDIKPKKDSEGNVKMPKQDVFVEGFLAMPVQFEAEITPRSEKRAEIVRKEWEKAKEGLDEDGQFLTNPI